MAFQTPPACILHPAISRPGTSPGVLPSSPRTSATADAGKSQNTAAEAPALPQHRRVGHFHPPNRDAHVMAPCLRRLRRARCPHTAAQAGCRWCFGRAFGDVNVSESDLSHNITYERREKRLEKCLTVAVITASSNGYTMSDTARGKGLAQLSITEPRVDAVPSR